MHSFSKWFIVDKEILTFIFTRVYHGDEERYYVYVTDKEHSLYSFTMMKNELGEWVIKDRDRLPSSIISKEEQLADAIKKYG